jgi:hypothetical protein
VARGQIGGADPHDHAPDEAIITEDLFQWDNDLKNDRERVL